MPRLRAPALSALLALLGLALRVQAAPAHLALAFSDSEFDNAEWELTVLMDGPGGTITATQVISGGNPGAYRNVTHVLNTPEGGQRSRVVGLHLPIGASYNPQLEGPIAFIDYSQDALGIEITGAGMRTNPLILQNGNAYLAPGPLVTQPVWTTVSLSGLTEVDFALLRPDLGVDISVHPDFSESGAPLRLGFASSNSTGSNCCGFTMVAGIDNWSGDTLPITVVPEPSTLALLAVCLAALMIYRRRIV